MLTRGEVLITREALTRSNVLALAGVMTVALALGHDAARAVSWHAAAREPDTNGGPIIRVGLARPGGGGRTVTPMPLETYVARVLAGEAARDSGPAALDALAITIRTFALANLGRHHADGFDLCDATHCQVVRTASQATERAARATTGKTLMFGGGPAQVFYTASCGGRSERPSAVWPGAEDPPFLPSRPDPAHDRSPWSAELATAALERALGAAGFRGHVRDIRVLSRTESGRVAAIRLKGLEPDEISGQDLRVVLGRTLGWQHVKSAAFDVERTADGYRFAGNGLGHGVGLCVIGSTAMAAKGRTAEEILSVYFPGLSIGSAPAAVTAAGAAANDVLLSLPAGDEGERRAILALVRQARDDLARRLGRSAPDRLVLRFHPTVLSYERATGLPWYGAGAIVGREIHFVPLAVLRDSGILERTIRRQIVHRLTDDVLASRSLWVREGMATYFAGVTPSPFDRRRVSCPRDAELREPVSPGALSNAYARAEACVARQLDAGRNWMQVQ